MVAIAFSKEREQMTFSDLFKAATGFDPYPYQVDFATRPDLPS
jgi:hypothetical protein